MNPNEKSWSSERLDELYRKSEDPWNLASRDYEKRKYEHTLSELTIWRRRP